MSTQGNEAINLDLDEGINLDLGGTVVGEPTFNMPEAKIGLAKRILLAIFYLILMTYVVSFLPDDYVTQRSIKFAEGIYQSVVPIAAMVIGYYFAKD